MSGMNSQGGIREGGIFLDGQSRTTGLMAYKSQRFKGVNDDD